MEETNAILENYKWGEEDISGILGIALEYENFGKIIQRQYSLSNPL